MTLPNRKPVHTRHITCNGYLRDDGLLDVEAELQDISPDGTDLLFKIVPPAGVIHHMRVTVTVSIDDMVIRDVCARTLIGPTEFCREIETAYDALKGLTLRRGFRQAVKARVGGVGGCTHLTELLGPLATTAIQSGFAVGRAVRNGRRPADQPGPMPKPAVIGTCHTYRPEARRWRSCGRRTGAWKAKNRPSRPADGVDATRPIPQAWPDRSARAALARGPAARDGIPLPTNLSTQGITHEHQRQGIYRRGL